MFPFSVILVALFVPLSFCDIYLHNPRGSNNRYNEETRPRTNAKRMFDSQNNARGGYNVGGLYYYAGSKLMIEWTNQHGCSDPVNHCEIILQYMCHDLVRDGVNTQTIPDDQSKCANNDCNTDFSYGMNEDKHHYAHCYLRERNKGLFVADQRVGGRAIHTRQDRAGTRYGYECPEERDYYPYWHPTPWRDIAVLTNDVHRCDYYLSRSENVEPRGYCYFEPSVIEQMVKARKIIPNSEADCNSFWYPKEGELGAVRGEWRVSPSHGLDPPDCRETEHSRVNHLGNGPGGYPNSYNWTIPDIDASRCALRIRYNISTGDYDGWDTYADDDPVPFTSISDEDAKARGLKLKNDPEIQLFGELPNFKLKLNVQTDQHGRTFQDRSHVFAIRRRPTELQNVDIHNLNVRGKRGNIVQVYPAVEYDYVPNTLHLADGDFLHVQWTGSNNNPPNNDGEGRARTDRSNMLIQAPAAYVTEPETTSDSHWSRSYPASLHNSSLLGLSIVDRDALATLSNIQHGGDMYLLDDAGTYFDLQPRRITGRGTYHVMCSRNNNFSNRSQKGRIVILPYPVSSAALGWGGGRLELRGGSASVHVPARSLTSLHKLQLELWPRDHAEQRVKDVRGDVDLPGSDYASDFLVLHPESRIVSNNLISIKLKLNEDAGSKVSIYRANSNSFGTWTRLEADIDDDGVASFQADGGGVFIARTGSNVALIAGVVVTLLLITALVIGTVLFCRRHPNYMQKFSKQYRKCCSSQQTN